MSRLEKLRKEEYGEASRINAYSTDASGFFGAAVSVVTPMNEREIQDAIRMNPKITIRGGGSGVRGGSIPGEGSAVVDLSKMDKIIEIDPSRNIAVVEAGVIIQDLNDELEKYGLEFPIVPMSGSISTIGGMIAINSTGLRSTKYKKISEWVLEIDIIDGNGKEKKISRVDASNVVGMEGITGIIYRAKLKLINIPQRSMKAYRSTDMFRIIELVRKLKLLDEVSMIFLVNPELSQMMGLESVYHLFIEFESDKGELKEREYRERLELIENIPYFAANLGFTRVEDSKVFLDKVVDISDFLKENKIPYYADMGMGIVHPIFKDGDEEIISEMYKFVRRMRGQIVGSLGYGRMKGKYMDINDRKLVQRIKKRYDSNNKLNSGVIIDADEKFEEPSREAVEEMIKEIDRQEERREKGI